MLAVIQAASIAAFFSHDMHLIMLLHAAIAIMPCSGGFREGARGAVASLFAISGHTKGWTCYKNTNSCK